jgi:hypothetical protein
MTGEFGLCGYFKEYDHDLSDDERLRFAKGELPPPFDPAVQPEPPADQWNELRLAKANRNYAMEYIRNGLCELAGVIGEAETRELGGLAARLIGLQYFPETAAMVGTEDGDVSAAAGYLARMFSGMGDEAAVRGNGDSAAIEQTGLRIARGLAADEAELVLACWAELWFGAISSQRQLKTLSWQRQDDQVRWTIAPRTA